MISDVLLGGGIGVLIALILSIPALIAEFRRRHEGHPLLLDVHRIGARELTDRETFAFGILLHLLLGLIFGLLYPLNPEVLSFGGVPYSLSALGVYAAVLYVIAGVIVLPLMGAGLFGWSEDRWSWFELLMSMVVLVLLYWLVTGWFQPSWFFVA